MRTSNKAAGLASKGWRRASQLAGLPLMLAIGAPAMAATIATEFDGDDSTNETLELYGIMRLSVDYGDSDLNGAPENKGSGLTDGGLGVSSNSTLLGFRGSYGLKDSPYKLSWQIEQQINLDNNSGTETWSSRDTFLGIQTPVGLFRAGLMDTPFKSVGAANSLFSTTIGDARTILGRASSAGSSLDLRGSNAIHWSHTLAGMQVAVQYAADQESIDYDGGKRGTHGFVDDNDGSAISASLSYGLNGLTVSAAYAHYEEIYGGQVDAWRTGLKYQLGAATIGGIFENIDADDNVAAGRLSRTAYGLYGQYRVLPKTTVGLQWMHANESDFGDDSADQLTLGLYHTLMPKLTTYVMASTTRNDDKGRYQVAGFAHGDKVATVDGGDPFAFSVGAQYSF